MENIGRENSEVQEKWSNCVKSRQTFGLQGYEKMKKADLIANLMREDPKEENSNKDDHDKSVHSRDQQPGSNHEPREPRESRDDHEPRGST